MGRSLMGESPGEAKRRDRHRITARRLARAERAGPLDRAGPSRGLLTFTRSDIVGNDNENLELF